ncbi:IS630 family transposase [Saprospiraceae bacterium]|nr:IS630 family transposase [Saprospiraceae bacterium]
MRLSLNKNKVNLYFQDESRFGLLTHTGSVITACGVRPKVQYQHKFANTYLWGSYSPIDGDSFVYEINGVSTKIFEAYLQEFSKHREDETKIVIIDNAGFHSTKNIQIPKNIILLNIPPYCPELNPCEQIWAYIKQRFKNKTFDTMKNLKKWLHKTVNEMEATTIKSIVSNHHYIDAFYATN